MKRTLPFLAALLSGATVVAAAHEAHACGGCVAPPEESTQVTGHRMIFAASKTQTTLYDQIEYAGSPESFAWFLPISSEVEIGLSTDTLFALLGDASKVVVYPPPLECARSSDRGDVGLASSEDSDGDDTVYVAPEQEVTVIAQEVVGPYETVQIESKTPGALANWLTEHGYFVPADVEPIIDAYQAEGLGFLAMKLVPGEGVRSMRPVRITTPGAGLTLPLRMVAAGTGAMTQVTLFVLGEGRYEAVGSPNLEIDRERLLWDWTAQSSNYRFLRDSVLDETKGFGWLTEVTHVYSRDALKNRVEGIITNNPGTTGWGDDSAGVTELDDARADLDKLFAGIDEGSLHLTRMYARLSRPALAKDLTLGASAEQAQISGLFQAAAAVGPPPCQPGDGDEGGFTCGIAKTDRTGTTGYGASASFAFALGAFAMRRRRSRASTPA